MYKPTVVARTELELEVQQFAVSELSPHTFYVLVLLKCCIEFLPLLMVIVISKSL